MSQETVESAFAYDKLPKNLNNYIESHGYQAFCDPTLKDFVCFKNLNAQSDRQTKGFKFHISIDDPKDDKDGNFAKAWPIIVKHLMAAGVADFKVVRGDARYKSHMEGKQVTIYAFKDAQRSATALGTENDADGLKSWQTIFQGLTEELAKAGIRPGKKAVTRNEDDSDDEEALSDHDVNGCNYISYRDDGASSKQDPYKNIQIKCTQQPPRVNNSHDKKSLLSQKQHHEEEIKIHEAELKIMKSSPEEEFKAKMNGIGDLVVQKQIGTAIEQYLNLYEACLKKNDTVNAQAVNQQLNLLKDHINQPKHQFTKKDISTWEKEITDGLKKIAKAYKPEPEKVENTGCGWLSCFRSK